MPALIEACRIKLRPWKIISQKEKHGGKQNHTDMCREQNLRNQKLKVENEKLAKQNLGRVLASMPSKIVSTGSKVNERCKIFHAYDLLVILATSNCAKPSQDVGTTKRVCRSAEIGGLQVSLPAANL